MTNQLACKKIIDKGENYVFYLKENQKSFYEDIELFINDKNSVDELEIFTARNKNNGRIPAIIAKGLHPMILFKMA